VGIDDALVVLPILLVVGAVLAAFSANFAITRYLKV
jgi:cell division transport system permease protein